MRICVDSRKTGFPTGKREFYDSPAEALAVAEMIARQKENDGAASFSEISPSQRRDAAEALALLDGSGSLLDAARLFVREASRQRELANVPTVTEAIELYLASKCQEVASGELSQLTLTDLQSKLQHVDNAFGERKAIPAAVAKEYWLLSSGMLSLTTQQRYSDGG